MTDVSSQNEISKPSNNLFEMSSFASEIMKIAMEEGDFISEETMRDLEQKIKPDILPKTYSINTPPPPVMDVSKEVDNLKKVIEVVKVMVDVGSFVSDKLGKYLGPIGTAAGFVKDIIDYFEPEKEDPVMKELGELKKQLTALSQKMTAQFDDLKSFIVEQDFYNRYTIAMSTLYMYMLDTLSGKSKESVIHFEEVYKESKPQRLVYEMLAKLEQETSNPLKWAMKTNLNSRFMFNKWKGILESVLTEALFLEVYASGLLPSVGSYGVTMILEKIGRYEELVKQWDEYYLTTSDYWPKGIEKLINDVHENKSLQSKDDKMNELWKNIESIHTNEQFYAVVFPSDQIWGYHNPYTAHAIISDREGFVIMVWMSYKTRLSFKKWIKHYVEQMMYFNRIYQDWQFNHWAMVRAYLQPDRVKIYGEKTHSFFFVVAAGRDHVASRYSKVDNWDYGPGFITYDAKLECNDGWTNTWCPLFYVFGA